MLTNNTQTVREICDAIGRKVISEQCGVQKAAVSQAVVKNKFPSSWVSVIRHLSAKQGLPYPSDDLFGIIPAPDGEEAA